MLLDGEGTKQDQEAAVKHFSKAAKLQSIEQISADAEHLYGYLIRTGQY